MVELWYRCLSQIVNGSGIMVMGMTITIYEWENLNLEGALQWHDS
jgi:hypothetical protein